MDEEECSENENKQLRHDRPLSLPDTPRLSRRS
jgi:hypothetical protein